MRSAPPHADVEGMPTRPSGPHRSVVAIRFALLAAVLAAIAPPSAFAEDTIILTNGNEVRGRIVSEDDEGVKIDIGGGKMTFRRSQIAEVRREKPPEQATGAAPVDAAADLAAARSEHAVLYTGGVRSGTRTTRVRRESRCFVFEEERTDVSPAGVVVREVRTIERSDLDFRPLSLSVRTTRTADGNLSHSSVAADVRTGRIYVTAATDGERTKTDATCPAEPHFAGGLRERFLRQSRALGGRFEASVFDVATLRFNGVTYVEGGVRTVVVAGKRDSVRVVRRVGAEVGRATAVTEEDWVRPDLSSVLCDTDAGRVRAVTADARTVTLLRSGASDAAAALDAAARVTWRDDEAKWTIAKPDPSWTFGSPASRAAGRRLAVRNEAFDAIVEVSVDDRAEAGATPQRAAESLRRDLRSALGELTGEKPGFIERDGLRILQVVATGADARGPLHVVLRIVQTVPAGTTGQTGTRTHRLVASVPEAHWAAIGPDVERVLDSFRAD
jgi:hypothetical protein